MIPQAVEFQNRRKCTAVTKVGQPCQAWAAVGTLDVRCIKHTEDPKRSAGGVGFAAGAPICYCGDVRDDRGNPIKHRPGVAPCKVGVVDTDRFLGSAGQPPPPETSTALAVPAATFDGVEAGEFLRYLQLLADGASPKIASTGSGVSRARIERRAERDPHFAAALTEATRLGLDPVIDALYGLAVGRYGAPSLPAIQYLLSHRDPSNWKPDIRQVELTATVSQAPMSAERRAELMAEIEALSLALGRPPIQARVLEAAVLDVVAEDDDAE